MSRPFILFITGTSGSGKTSLYESLRADSEFKDIEFHDIDENGVPPVAREAWRKYRVENLLYQAARRQQDGKSSIICGISRPHEILESRYYKPGYNVHILVIEASPRQIRERLMTRINEHQAKGIFDESFNQGTRSEAVESNLRLRLALRNAVEGLKRGHRLDASKLSKDEMHRQVKEIVGKAAK